jgi:hypothetical protein
MWARVAGSAGPRAADSYPGRDVPPLGDPSRYAIRVNGVVGSAGSLLAGLAILIRVMHYSIRWFSVVNLRVLALDVTSP